MGIKIELKSTGITTAPVVFNEMNDCPPVTGHVSIIMATYNGARFIQEQICSIQAQSYTNWVLYVRDDGSRDDTIEKLIHIEAGDHRIRLVRDELGNQGAIGNFSVLMNVALEECADYVFFADQDDVWHPEKLASMLAAMGELERTCSVDTPLLLHCDLVVVDEELQTIAGSFVRFSRLWPETADLGVLLCQNQVTGCACLINRALLALASNVPANVLMHDWWLALLAAAAGKIGFVPLQLVMYRQHGGNVLGAVSYWMRLKKLLFSPKQWKIHLQTIRCSFLQAELLEERIHARDIVLSPVVEKQIRTYAHILNDAPFSRAKNMHAQKISRSVRSTGLIFDLLVTMLKRTGRREPVA